MDWIASFLERYPELATFLAIALGYLIGDAKIGGFSLGPVTGSLFAGLLIGQFAEVPVSPMAKNFLFLLFLFGIGYSVGPQFLQSLRKGGVHSVVLAILCSVTGLFAAFVVARFLSLDAGYAAGLLSGGLTQSPAIGTATEAISALELPEAERAQLIAHVAVADAICYVFGAAGAIWFISDMAPKLLGVDLVAEARELEAKLGVARTTPGVVSGHRPFDLRAYSVPHDAAIVGQTIGDAEKRFAQHRLLVLRVRRSDTIIEARPDLIVQEGDTLVIGGRRRGMVEILGPMGAEVDDIGLLDMPIMINKVLLTRQEIAGKTLLEVAGQDWARAVYLRSVSRGAQALPIAPGLVLERGDVLEVVGPESAVAKASPQLGVVIAPTVATDFVVVGLAIFIGGLLGTLAKFSIGTVAVSIGTSAGALLAGLVVGHMRTRHPLFGRIPEGAVALMTALGLAAFVAMTGLHAGPVFLPALKEAGLGLLLGGVIVTLAPLLVGLAFGRFVLGMNPILLLGALAGANTMTAAMAAVQVRADSPVPVLGYTPAYPVAQILLTLWGSVIVALVAN